MSPEELALNRRAVEKNNSLRFDYQEIAEDLLEHIDSLVRQIEVLKAGWIAERASEHIGCIMHCDVCTSINGSQECIKKFYDCCRTEARRQLAAEHPDLFCEPTKMMADSEKEARP